MKSVLATNFFQGKNILITGGTGSIGSHILHSLLPLKPKKITIFSRDEYKQYRLKFLYSSTPATRIEYLLGDVRDAESITYASKKTDILFHCSAYKHVPQSEEMPEEFIKTNVLGASNVKRAALHNNIPVIVSISSDKAVNPSNTMGLTKALQEKIFASHYLQNEVTSQKFINVRFGNVIGTKGSIFPILYHQIMNNQPITLTDPQMTRFFMTQKDAVDLIFWATINGKDGETVIKKMRSMYMKDLVNVFLTATNKGTNYQVNQLGIRVGEKLHESLITEDELFKVKNKEDYYIVGPYTEKEIENNIILSSKSKLKQSMDEFKSATKANLFSQKEILELVNQYIEETKHINQII